MVMLPDTIRVRKQGGRDHYGKPVYLDEFEDVGAAHFRMDEERFKEALVDVYKDWITVFKAPATFRARLTVKPAGRVETARQARMERLDRWIEERCVMDTAALELSRVLVADCRKWHEERDFELPHPTLVGRMLQRHAVGTRGSGGRDRMVLGVALKDA